MSVSNYFPAAVVVAIILFVIREFLEHRRRKASDARKVNAYKRVIARECERAGLSLALLEQIIEVIQQVQTGYQNKSYTIEQIAGGAAQLVVHVQSVEEGTGQDVYPIRSIDRSLMNKLLVEIASLSDDLYRATERAHDALGQVEHFRTMMIDGGGMPKSWTESERLQRIADIAESTVKDAQSEIASLYKYCTGKEEVDLRMG